MGNTYPLNNLVIVYLKPKPIKIRINKIVFINKPINV
jgi:hypothetical protein